MDKKVRISQRSSLGYGSSYRRGGENEVGTSAEIGTVMGRQVWLVRPDKVAATEDPCIWMAAGVGGFKSCKNFYDCSTCKYDHAMMKGVEKGRYMSWQDSMRKKSGLDRLCRHSLTNRISKRACAYDYLCSRCDFDQLYYDQYSVHAVIKPVEMMDIKGFKIPQGYYLHRGHAWARVEDGGRVRVGADDFVRRLLGPMDHICAPLIGKEVRKDEKGITLSRAREIASLLSPVSGVVTSVNPGLSNEGRPVDEDPYSEGWIMMLEPYRLREEIKDLMMGDETGLFMNGQVEQLYQIIEDVSGPLAADGGNLDFDIYGNMPELGWDRLIKTFLCN